MSEEDIKILEELLEEGFEAMCPLEAQALENLIKAYKELEEENKKYKYLYQKALDNTIKSDRENIRKDNIIDKISQNPFNELRANGIRFCGTDIKQYFEKKVSDGDD